MVQTSSTSRQQGQRFYILVLTKLSGFLFATIHAPCGSLAPVWCAHQSRQTLKLPAILCQQTFATRTTLAKGKEVCRSVRSKVLNKLNEQRSVFEQRQCRTATVPQPIHETLLALSLELHAKDARRLMPSGQLFQTPQLRSPAKCG